MDNIISLSIIIIVIGYVLYMFISNREKFTDHHCNHILAANDVKGQICLGDVFDPSPTRFTAPAPPTTAAAAPAPTAAATAPTAEAPTNSFLNIPFSVIDWANTLN
jgi:hypothetical protein